MKRILGHDSVTGVTEWFEYDPVTDNTTIWSEQPDADIKVFLDQVTKQRNDADFTKRGIKNDWWKYASLPPIVIMELRNKGIDVFNPDHTKALIREINANYPSLKTTEKWHR